MAGTAVDALGHSEKKGGAHEGGGRGRLDIPSLGIGNKNHNFYLVFGRFPAELGPETRSNGSGSKNGAGRTRN